MHRESGPDDLDEFIHAAVRAYALGATPPPPPADPRWVDRAHVAGVLLTIVQHLVDHGHRLPEPAHAHRVMSTAMQMSAARDLERLGFALDDVGVSWAALKGPVLASTVFRTGDSRDFSDLDVLVHPSDFPTTVTALREAGAAPLPVDWDRVIKARTAELSFILPGGTLLDLHWSIFNEGEVRDAYSRLKTSMLIAGGAPRSARGVAYRSLGDVDLVIHTLVHGCLSGGHRLRWLLDAQQSLRWLAASPHDFADRVGQLGLRAPASAMVRRTATVLDPRVAMKASRLGPPTSWDRVLDVVGRVCPPSSPSTGRRSGRAWFASTRPTSTKSARQMINHVPWNARRNEGLHGTAGSTWSEPRYLEWLATAAEEALLDPR